MLPARRREYRVQDWIPARAGRRPGSRRLAGTLRGPWAPPARAGPPHGCGNHAHQKTVRHLSGPGSSPDDIVATPARQVTGGRGGRAGRPGGAAGRGGRAGRPGGTGRRALADSRRASVDHGLTVAPFDGAYWQSCSSDPFRPRSCGKALPRPPSARTARTCVSCGAGVIGVKGRRASG